MANVVLLGTFDTKGSIYQWMSTEIEAAGCNVTSVDAGTHEPRGIAADVSNAQVARAAGYDIESLRADNDRGAAVAALAEGSRRLLLDMYEQGKVDAVIAVGGSGGSSIASHAMQALPIGVPKILVSTMASGDVEAYVGTSDICLMYSIVDVAGMNEISRAIFGNACAAVVGMAGRFSRSREAEPIQDHKKLIAASMFGVTTPAVDVAREFLEEKGYEVIVFHATGSGGKAMESLVESGFFAGVLDLTTTELADELVGGVLTAGPTRLTAAGKKGIPQVVSVGALDMANFGPRDHVPEKFEGRTLYIHNPTVTLMRTTGDEMAQLGKEISSKLSVATGPTALFIPRRGVSAIDAEGGPFYDPDADARLFHALTQNLDNKTVELFIRDENINDPAFALTMAEKLHDYISAN